MVKGFRALAACACVALGIAALPAFAQQGGPTVRIIAGYPAGGNVDLLARIFAKVLSEALGRPVIVENKPGAGGQTAAEFLKAAAPDGNTLMLAPDAAAVVRPAGMKRPTFDPTRDFVAVAEIGAQDYAFAISPEIPARDFREFQAWARAHPKESNYGSAGVGGITHLASILIGRAMDAPLQHVPFGGSPAAVNAVVAGHIAATFQPIGTLAPQAQAGKIRVIAVSGTRRSELFPDVPTFTELGHPSLKIVTWFGLFAPARTPPEIVSQYNAIVVNASRQPAIRSQLKALTLDVREFSPARFGTEVKNDLERWTTVIKAAGISLDE